MKLGVSHRRERAIEVDRTPLAGQGIAQPLLIDVEEHLRSGALIDLFPTFPDELFPLNVLYPSNHHVPAKVRAFIDFLVAESSLSGAWRVKRR